MSANSARAIPSNKYLQKVLDNPFMPIWTKQQKGMSGELLDEASSEMITTNYRYYLEQEYPVKKIEGTEDYYATISLKDLYKYLISKGAHKQNANRLLAPFAWTTCIISGTEWDNFFELRCPKYESADDKIHFSKKAYIKGTEYIYGHRPDLTSEGFKPEFWERVNKSSAQPEFQVIAEMLYDLYQEANWKESKYHIPFQEDIIDKYLYPISSQSSQEEVDQYYNDMMKISASMCAKLSYNTQDNEDTLDKHLERANLLIEHKHQEPFSHQTISMDEREYIIFHKSSLISKEQYIKRGIVAHNYIGDKVLFKDYGWCYNLKGFISQRYILENY
jgi:hypothetical protein